MAGEKNCWLGFDLGGTKMLAVVFDERFRVLGRKRRRTKGALGQAAGLKRIVETMEMAMEAAGVNADRLRGIGVGCPGPLDLDRGVVIEMPNLGWKRTPVKKTLEEHFGCTAHILNDVDAGVFGEYDGGAARGARCVVGVFPGTGIGGGAVYEGRILRGKSGSCLEIGHMPVVPDGPVCGCGNRGCLEAVASRLAIAGEAAKAAYRGAAPHLAAHTGSDIKDIRSGALAASVEGGDTVVEAIVRAAAYRVGTTMAGVIHLLAPDQVLIGGGLVEAMPELYAEEVMTGIQAHVMPAYRKTFKLKVARLGDDAGVRGAAAWARTVETGA